MQPRPMYSTLVHAFVKQILVHYDHMRIPAQMNWNDGECVTLTFCFLVDDEAATHADI